MCFFVSFKVYFIADKTSQDSTGHLTRIPRKFEIPGDDHTLTEFKKYIQDIQDLTIGKNISIMYKVKVESMNSNKKNKRRLLKKIKSKKYNVPLKKQNMKLSNFEMLLRKLAEENGAREPNYEVLSLFTTEVPDRVMTTKLIQLKFKPLLGRVRTNYTKVIKPVRNKIITLTK